MSLKRVTPPGCLCIDAARLIPPGANINDVDYQNYGGPAVVHRQTITCHKTSLDVDVTTVEYLFCHATAASRHFVLPYLQFIDLAAKSCQLLSLTNCRRFLNVLQRLVAPSLCVEISTFMLTTATQSLLEHRRVSDKLHRVLNAAARVVTGTRKFDRGLSQLLHAD